MHGHGKGRMQYGADLNLTTIKDAYE